jgi:Protein of unknown function (DUF993)
MLVDRRAQARRDLCGMRVVPALMGGGKQHLAERRSPDHLIRVFELAAAAGALRDPDLAADRLRQYLAQPVLT